MDEWPQFVNSATKKPTSCLDSSFPTFVETAILRRLLGRKILEWFVDCVATCISTARANMIITDSQAENLLAAYLEILHLQDKETDLESYANLVSFRETIIELLEIYIEGLGE